MNQENYNWYVLQTYNAIRTRVLFKDEKKKVEKLKKILQETNMLKHVKEFFIPIVEAIDAYGKPYETNLAPGYVYIKMFYTEKIASIIKSSNTFLLMGGFANPTTVDEESVNRFKKNIESKKNELNSFYIGENVVITREDLSGFDGVITEINNKLYSVAIEIFGCTNILQFHEHEIKKITF